jgi:hypothetical protein
MDSKAYALLIKTAEEVPEDQMGLPLLFIIS